MRGREAYMGIARMYSGIGPTCLFLLLHREGIIDEEIKKQK